MPRRRRRGGDARRGRIEPTAASGRRTPRLRLQHALRAAPGPLPRPARPHGGRGRAASWRASGSSRRSIDEVVGELREQGYLDDARFAQRFAEDRRRARRLGRRADRAPAARARRRRRARSPPRSASRITRASSRRRSRSCARRFPEPPATPRDRERALGVLVRKGYELELAYDAVRAPRGRSGLRVTTLIAPRRPPVLRSAPATDRPARRLKTQQINEFHAESAASVSTATKNHHRGRSDAAPGGRARQTPTQHRITAAI